MRDRQKQRGADQLCHDDAGLALTGPCQARHQSTMLHIQTCTRKPCWSFLISIAFLLLPLPCFAAKLGEDASRKDNPTLLPLPGLNFRKDSRSCHGVFRAKGRGRQAGGEKSERGQSGMRMGEGGRRCVSADARPNYS